MPQNKRQTQDGFVVTRYHNGKNEYSYYVDAGVEGKMLVWDTGIIPVSLLLFCMSWQLEKVTAGRPKDPAPEFNSNGWRL